MKTSNLILSVLFFILAGLFLSCSSTRKLQSNTKETAKIDEQRTEENAGNVIHFADTTKKEDRVITYTKIEFYPPEALEDDTTIIESSSPSKTNGTKHRKHGAIKSIESYTLNSSKVANGINKDSTATTSIIKDNKTTQVDKNTTTKETKEADPYKWRFIFGIIIALAVIGTVAYFAISKSTIAAKVVGFIKKIFCS